MAAFADEGIRNTSKNTDNLSSTGNACRAEGVFVDGGLMWMLLSLDNYILLSMNCSYTHC